MLSKILIEYYSEVWRGVTSRRLEVDSRLTPVDIVHYTTDLDDASLGLTASCGQARHKPPMSNAYVGKSRLKAARGVEAA